ncbi:MAG: hypothetical protein AB7F86_09310 [Bdellovibrionales bacterium]
MSRLTDPPETVQFEQWRVLTAGAPEPTGVCQEMKQKTRPASGGAENYDDVAKIISFRVYRCKSSARVGFVY